VSDVLFLAVEQAIPRDHPAAWLAVPLGLLFFGGSIILLLWSSYGWRKALAIYGTSFFGFGFLIGLFWWLGWPGVPPGLGISHLPGEISADHQPRWHPFEAGSDRGALFPVHENPEAFQDTISRFSRDAAGDAAPATPGVSLRPHFFDLLHVDGHDLIDEPLDFGVPGEAFAPAFNCRMRGTSALYSAKAANSKARE
jgi:hypothetical protein